MRRGTFWLLGLALFALPGLASAATLQKGSSMLAIQLSRGVADLTGDVGGVLITSSRPELGVQGQYWIFLADEYGANITAGIGYFKESETADPAVLSAGDYTETMNSWQVRIGGDRFAKVTDKLQIFAGPGIQMWSGKRTIKVSSGDFEDPSTMRWALSGRIGANIAIGENFGLIGHIGQYWAYATAEEGGATTKWLPSGSEGAMGFAFGF
jgi:hypothetical protein